MSEETIPQMREALDNANKRIKELEKESGTLSKENRRLLARDVAREQGYDVSRGELFATANPDADITAEALDAFVQQFGLAQSSGDSGGDGEGGNSDGGEGDGGGSVGSPDLSQLSRGGSRPGDSADGAGREKMTRKEWQDLAVNDPVAAQEAVRQGRVTISSGNPFGDAKAVAPGNNPYRQE